MSSEKSKLWKTPPYSNIVGGLAVALILWIIKLIYDSRNWFLSTPSTFQGFSVIILFIIIIIGIRYFIADSKKEAVKTGSLSLVFTFGGQTVVNVYSGSIPINEFDELRNQDSERYNRILASAQEIQLEIRNDLGYNLINAQLHIEAIRAKFDYRIIDDYPNRQNRKYPTVQGIQGANRILVIQLDTIYQNIPILVFDQDIRVYVYAKKTALYFDWICTINADNLNEPIVKTMKLLAVPIT